MRLNRNLMGKSEMCKDFLGLFFEGSLELVIFKFEVGRLLKEFGHCELESFYIVDFMLLQELVPKLVVAILILGQLL